MASSSWSSLWVVALALLTRKRFMMLYAMPLFYLIARKPVKKGSSGGGGGGVQVCPYGFLWPIEKLCILHVTRNTFKEKGRQAGRLRGTLEICIFFFWKKSCHPSSILGTRKVIKLNWDVSFEKYQVNLLLCFADTKKPRGKCTIFHPFPNTMRWRA